MSEFWKVVSSIKSIQSDKIGQHTSLHDELVDEIVNRGTALESQLKEALEQNAELRKDNANVRTLLNSNVMHSEIHQLRARLALFEKLRSFSSLICRCEGSPTHKDECDITQFNEAIRALDAAGDEK